MLNALYSLTEVNSTEAKSVLDFAELYIGTQNDEMENRFYEAIHDSRFAGFCAGLRVALRLAREIGLK